MLGLNQHQPTCPDRASQTVVHGLALICTLLLVCSEICADIQNKYLEMFPSIFHSSITSV